MLGVTAALVLLGLVIGSRPCPVEKLRGWLGSLLGCAASVGVLTALIFTVYASNDLYNSFRVSNAYYVPSVFNELGFPYCFCHQFTTYPVDRPAGFDRSEAESWEEEAVSDETGKPVSVVMVMNEAFSDITDHDAFAFSPENDPLPSLHALEQDPHALSGHIVVPGFAGGTANTEFDVLTGIQTNALSKTTTSAFRVVNRNLDSLFRLFGADGYRTSFFHPGDDWFYNRENVYRWLGAEETRFVGQMADAAYKGRWVTDDYMAGLIEAEFEASAAAGQPLFHYTTTIQNHMSYTPDKYGEGYNYPDVPLNIPVSPEIESLLRVYIEGARDADAMQNHMSYTPDKYGEGYNYPDVPLNIPVSPEIESLLRVYIEGARDADAMLGRLHRYFVGREEPVVLVYFGDHLPYLGDSQQGYRELGMADAPTWETLDSYATPYVIWANDAAAETLDWEDAVAGLDLPEESDALSAAFLGAMVAELTGHARESAWFSFLNDLRREMPVVQKSYAQLPDGQLAEWALLDDHAPKQLEKWRQWSYYKLKYQEFPA